MNHERFNHKPKQTAAGQSTVFVGQLPGQKESSTISSR